MTWILYALIIACLVCMLLLAFAKPLGVLLRMMLSAIVGSVGLFICQWLGLGIGFNIATVMTVGLLGAPGFLGLLFLGILL